jgi:hypothetical protein
MTRESSDGSICDEIASDTDESEVSGSSTERVDLPEALDEAGDGMEPTYAEVEGKSSVRFSIWKVAFTLQLMQHPL